MNGVENRDAEDKVALEADLFVAVTKAIEDCTSDSITRPVLDAVDRVIERYSREGRLNYLDRGPVP